MPTRERKTWREKLEDAKGLPKVARLSGRKAERWGKTMVIPAPLEVDGLMRSVPRGSVTTINELRASLQKKHGTDSCCPITTGIFAWIAAHAAEEESEKDPKRATPYWRTLKNGGELNPKYPGGIAALRRKLAAEGHAFVKKGARTFVQDLNAKLYSPAAD